MKIAVFAYNSEFVGPIARELSKEHEIKIFPETDSEIASAKKVYDWGDMAFFDFCHYPILEILKSKERKPAVARLHGIEFYHEFQKINWKRIDHLVCSAPQLERMKFWSQQPTDVPITVLNIGTNLETFHMPKNKEPGKELCTAAFVNPRKRLYTTIETVAPLLDAGWRFHIRASMGIWRPRQNKEYACYINELVKTRGLTNKQVIVYPNKLPEPNFVNWLQSKDIFINNSTQEGYGKSVYDAMACGLYPLVYSWLGASKQFDATYIFSTQAELYSRILWWDTRTDKEKKQLSKIARKAAEKQDEKNVAKNIRQIIESVGET